MKASSRYTPGMVYRSRLLQAILPFVGGIAAAAPADAGTQTTSIAVSAIVQDMCSVAATPVAFGAYEPGQATAKDASGQVLVNCTMGTAYSIGLGAGSSATAAQRSLTDSNGNQLDYNLYQDSARSIVWGDTTGANTVSGTYMPGQQPLAVYGRIVGGQVVAAGGYSDSITVTVTY